MDSKIVTVVGTGYVGLPLCVLIKEAGHEVIGFDANAKIVNSLKSGKSTVEDVSDEQLAGITFTNAAADIENSDVYIICVPTPVMEDKSPDLRIVEAVRSTLEKHAKAGAMIICESTVGVGDTRKTFKDFAARGFLVANSPERIDPGRKDPALKDIPKLVGGLTSEATIAASAFYSTVFTTVVPLKNAEHSEASKLLENSFRAVNIMFANEMSDFCDKSGLDVHEIIDAASTKPYGFTPFRPWVGVGGHCIPCDPMFLIYSNKDCQWPILSTSMEAMYNRPSRLAAERTNPTVEKVLVCGVSYKPNVADTREAPQKEFCEQLLEQKIDVHFYDPLVKEFHGIQKVETLERLEDYDKVFVMHMHDEYKDQLQALAAFDHVEFFCKK